MQFVWLFGFLLSLVISDHCSSDPTIGCPSGSSCITQNKCPPFTDISHSDVWKYTCIGGKWEPTTCTQLPPENFKYPVDTIEALVNIPISPITPTIDCYNCIFKMTDGQSLPTGLSFQSTDGTISGTPTEAVEKTVTIIARAEEAASDATFDITFNIFSGCPADAGWPNTRPGDETAVVCDGDLVGYQTRRCSESSTWESVNTQHCLTRVPDEGVTFVDLSLHLIGGVTQQVKRENALGIVSSLLDFFPDLDMASIGIHAIYTINEDTGIYVRISASESVADEVFYTFKKEVGWNHVLTVMGEYITQNKKSYYSGSKAEFTLHSIEKYEFNTNSGNSKISFSTMILIAVIVIATVIVILCTIVIVCSVNVATGKLTRLEKKRKFSL